MAATSLIPRNGAVAIGSLLMDYNSFELDASQSIENVTPYGTNRYSKNAASGCPDLTINVGAFALAHATNTPATLGSGSSTSVTNFAETGGATGVTSTFTLDTSVTETLNVLVQQMKISHGRVKGAVPVNLVLRNQSEVTESWATS